MFPFAAQMFLILMILSRFLTEVQKQPKEERTDFLTNSANATGHPQAENK
jgi:hypothetical protein